MNRSNNGLKHNTRMESSEAWQKSGTNRKTFFGNDSAVVGSFSVQSRTIMFPNTYCLECLSLTE